MRKNTLGSLIWLRLTRFTHRSNQLSNDFLKPYDLTSAQFDVLMQVSNYQPLTQSELAEKVTVTQGGISRMLTRLEKDGLIERKIDWKTKTILLTAKGEKKLEAAFESQLEFQSSFFEECLSPEEQKQLYSLISRVYKNSVNKKVQSE